MEWREVRFARGVPSLTQGVSWPLIWWLENWNVVPTAGNGPSSQRVHWFLVHADDPISYDSPVSLVYPEQFSIYFYKLLLPKPRSIDENA